MNHLHKNPGITLGAGALIGLGATLARAVPGGATKSKLSFAGNVTPTPAAGTDVAFKFTNGTATCSPPTLKPAFASNGDFAAELDVSGCAGFFDGGDVTYTLKVGTGAESAAQALNPVPYAKYADRAVSATTANTATTATGAGGALETRLAALESKRVVKKGAVSYSLDGVYCGKTAAKVNGSIGGYGAMKSLCTAVAACGSSATAHACTLEEMTRSAALGVAPASGSGAMWLNAGVAGVYDTSAAIMDCEGLGLIRFRRHLAKGGYDGAHGTQGAAEAEAA